MVQNKFAAHFFLPHQRNAVTLFIHPLQLFMCLLWILLQMAVVFMYWDLPPLERAKAKESSICQSREEEESEQGLVEEDNDEEKPLMASQELAGSYGSVVTSSHTPAASNTTLNHISPPPSPVPPESNESSSPFKNFNISRGG